MDLKEAISKKLGVVVEGYKLRKLDTFPFGSTLMNRITSDGYLEATCHILDEDGDMTEIEKKTKGTSTSGFISLNHVYGKYKSQGNTLIITRKLNNVVFGLEYTVF